MHLKKFSDFATDDIALVGDKINIAELFNKPLVVTGFRMLTSKRDGKPLLHLQIEFEGRTRTAFTNSVVLIKQCEQYKDEMPFEATIIKVGSYYTFS